MARREVVITGIGLVSSLGEGADAHWDALAVAERPVPAIDRSLFPPFSVHRMVPLDLDRQIPKRGDQRQMEPWQRIGTYAAGLALADARAAGDLPLLARMDMIVAAGGGERDPEVDATILRDAPGSPEPKAFLNERLVNDLRPTLFLAQLANLLAGNISIVHKVTGSSRTLMGEESAGVSAVEVARRRIEADQGDISIVGGAFNAERYEAVADVAIGGKLWPGEPLPVWARAAAGGGLTLGSIGAFLVMESAEHAKARGVPAYARLSGVLNDRSRRTPGAARANAERQVAALRPQSPPPPALLSGAGGLKGPTLEERGLIEHLVASGAVAGVRAPLTMLGTVMEPAFPALVALAALALRRKGFYRPIDDTGLERPLAAPPDAILVTTWGHWRGEGMGLVEAVRED